MVGSLHKNAKTLTEFEKASNIEEGSSPADWSIVANLANNQNIQKTPKEQYTGKFTAENTREYIKDRYNENLKTLVEIGDPHIFKLYKTLMDEYPQLRIVKLIDQNIKDNANFQPISSNEMEKNPFHYTIGKNENCFPAIHYNFSNRETYIIKREQELNYEGQTEYDDRLGAKYFIKRLSFGIGADWRDCARNRKLVADEVLLHEFGHAYDFIENYMRHEYDEAGGDCKGPIVLYNSERKFFKNRREYQLASPTCGEFLHRKDKRYKEYEHRLTTMGINNYDEYLYALQQYYRDMPDESFADNFAIDYIAKHYDDYFTESHDYLDQRVHIDKNKAIELDPDFVHILNIHQGLGVEINRLEGNNVVKHVSGFLATNFYSGKNVYLYENGDPKNPGNKWRICQGVSGIYLTPIRDPETGRIERIVTFTDQDGVYYHMNRSQQKTETIEAKPEELLQDLGLKFGDKIQMIYHQTKDVRKRGNYNTGFGSINKAEIYSAKDNENQVLIHYGGRYVRSTIKRRWKTYYACHGGEEYEILPLSKD